MDSIAQGRLRTLQGLRLFVLLLGIVVGDKGTIFVTIVYLTVPNDYNFTENLVSSIFAILGYKFVENKYCQGSTMTGHQSLADAEAYCNTNDECGSITRDPTWFPIGKDPKWQWYGTCKGTDLTPSTQGWDAWVKPNYGEL